MGIAQNLKHLMDVKGISNYQLSKDLDVHATSVANWLSGSSKPIKRMQAKIADYFGITIQDLNGEELPEPQKIEKLTAENGSELSKERIQMLLDKMSAAELVELMGTVTDTLKRKTEG